MFMVDMVMVQTVDKVRKITAGQVTKETLDQNSNKTIETEANLKHHLKLGMVKFIFLLITKLQITN